MSWKRIRLLIWKEFTQLRRDRSMLPILFIMPVIQLVMFGYVVGSDVTQPAASRCSTRTTRSESQRVVDAFTSSSATSRSSHGPSNEAAAQGRARRQQGRHRASRSPRALGDAMHEQAPGADRRHRRRLGQPRRASVAAGYASRHHRQPVNAEFYAAEGARRHRRPLRRRTRRSACSTTRRCAR